MRLLAAFVLSFLTQALCAQIVLTSDVSVNVVATPSVNLVPGQLVLLTITVTNNGPTALDNFAVDSANAYPDQIDVSHLNTDCLDVQTAVVDAATTFWYYEVWYPTDTARTNPRNWPLSVGESRTCHMTVALMPTAPQSVPFDFHLDSFWTDLNAGNNVGRVVLQRAAAAAVPIPALSLFAQMLLVLSLTLVAGRYAASRCS